MGPTPSAHRLRRGLPGYLILFAPHAFAPQRQYRPRVLPSLLVFLLISAHFTATPGIPSLYRTLVMAVSSGVSELSPGFSHPTYQTAYEPFTPNKSGQRLRPTYYRGCWHVVGRRFFCRYRHFRPSLKGVYNPKAFFPHAALLRQAFAHCARFPTAASRRSLGRVSVPVWLIVLSDQLPVDALVSLYLTN